VSCDGAIDISSAFDAIDHEIHEDLPELPDPPITWKTAPARADEILCRVLAAQEDDYFANDFFTSINSRCGDYLLEKAGGRGYDFVRAVPSFDDSGGGRAASSMWALSPAASQAGAGVGAGGRQSVVHFMREEAVTSPCGQR